MERLRWPVSNDPAQRGFVATLAIQVTAPVDLVAIDAGAFEYGLACDWIAARPTIGAEKPIAAVLAFADEGSEQRQCEFRNLISRKRMSGCADLLGDHQRIDAFEMLQTGKSRLANFNAGIVPSVT